jgi:hypothetical protein
MCRHSESKTKQLEPSAIRLKWCFSSTMQPRKYATLGTSRVSS